MRNMATTTSLTLNGKSITNIRYADDTILLADNEQLAQNFLKSLHVESEKRGLTINMKKTKIMVFSKKQYSPTCSVKLKNVVIEQVESSDCLGSLLTQDCKCVKEIRKRNALAKKSFMDKKSILTNKSLSIESRKRFVKCYVWSVLLYGCEAWTVGKATETTLMAMEMWCWRKMLRISWIKKLTNAKVLDRTEKDINGYHQEKATWFCRAYYKREWFRKALFRREI